MTIAWNWKVTHGYPVNPSDYNRQVIVQLAYNESVIDVLNAGPWRSKQHRRILKMKPLSQTSNSSIYWISARFDHSDCGSSTVKSYAKKWTLLEQNCGANSEIEPATFWSKSSVRSPNWYMLVDMNSGKNSAFFTIQISPTCDNENCSRRVQCTRSGFTRTSVTDV